MEKKRIELGAVAEKARKSTGGLMGKAKQSLIKAVDQNGDGELDMQDLTIAADTLNNAAKKATVALKETYQEKSQELERRQLQPIFTEDLDESSFYLSKLIRVAPIDKRHAESDICKNSVGFMSMQKDLQVVNIYSDQVDAFGLSFYPDRNSEIYYVDPSDRNHYIALDDYFRHLKEMRVKELQKIAQDLGAKHFRVTYKEEKTSFSKSASKGNLNLKAIAGNLKAEAEKQKEEHSAMTIGVEAEAEFPGHEPLEPRLKYLQREPSIQSLIALRMDQSSPLSHLKYTLHLSNTSGIKEKEAVLIDGALKAMKIVGNATVTSEAQNEARRIFEYEIDF